MYCFFNQTTYFNSHSQMILMSLAPISDLYVPQSNIPHYYC